MQSLAARGGGVPRTTVARALKLGILQKTRSAIKPSLTKKNKEARIKYFVSWIC
jgi:hypothetical protein